MRYELMIMEMILGMLMRTKVRMSKGQVPDDTGYSNRVSYT